MGQEAATKVTRRDLRKLISDSATQAMLDADVRTRAHAAILGRGFFGRLKWLFFGK
jgi:hypothetical protein